MGNKIIRIHGRHFFWFWGMTMSSSWRETDSVDQCLRFIADCKSSEGTDQKTSHESIFHRVRPSSPRPPPASAALLRAIKSMTYPGTAVADQDSSSSEDRKSPSRAEDARAVACAAVGWEEGSVIGGSSRRARPRCGLPRVAFPEHTSCSSAAPTGHRRGGRPLSKAPGVPT